MSVFESLGQHQRQPTLNTQSTKQIQQARAQFERDPVGILRRCGMDIPDGMTDPQQIAMHLFQSRQIGWNGIKSS